MRLLLVLLLAAWLAAAAGAQGRPTVVVGSKAFPESWILGDALVQLARQGGASATHRKSLGATEIVYKALLQGSIDVYPEYTGTVAEVLVKEPGGRPSMARMLEVLADQGIGMSYPLGFNDGYGLAVRRSTATREGLQKISDLAAHPRLKFGLTPEFMGRQDGWPGLSAAYGLGAFQPLSMQHELAYAAVASGQVQVVDIYTTDPQIQKLDLVVLQDDKAFFPRYDAVLLYRADLPRRAPGAWASMLRLVGRLTEEEMIRANAMVALDQKDSEQAAAALLAQALGGASAPPPPPPAPSVARSILANTATHIKLVAISLAAAVVVGIPLGILATRSRALASLTLAGAGLLQTVPSLALLAFLIPFLGVGFKPALVALFLYSLLPIVNNTYTGLTTIPQSLSEAAQALGLSPAAQLLQVRLPMASPAILAGIKTSAVINVGTATLAALIGAGGLGQPILQGITLVDRGLIFQGAVPAALLALLVQGLFDLAERVLVPRGLRL
jgi:osmoprotectant transport system permease protein